MLKNKIKFIEYRDIPNYVIKQPMFRIIDQHDSEFGNEVDFQEIIFKYGCDPEFYPMIKFPTYWEWINEQLKPV